MDISGARAFQIFKNEEMNEVILVTYKHCIAALKANAEVFVVTKEQISWSSQGVELGVFPVRFAQPRLSFMSTFQSILNRDTELSGRFVCTFESNDRIEYQIVPAPEP